MFAHFITVHTCFIPTHSTFITAPTCFIIVQSHFITTHTYFTDIYLNWTQELMMLFRWICRISWQPLVNKLKPYCDADESINDSSSLRKILNKTNADCWSSPVSLLKGEINSSAVANKGNIASAPKMTPNPPLFASLMAPLCSNFAQGQWSKVWDDSFGQQIKCFSISICGYHMASVRNPSSYSTKT